MRSVTGETGTWGQGGFRKVMEKLLFDAKEFFFLNLSIFRIIPLFMNLLKTHYMHAFQNVVAPKTEALMSLSKHFQST